MRDLMTSFIEAKRKSLTLIIVSSSTSSGRSFLASSRNASISPTTSVAFEPATWNTIVCMPGCPSVLERYP